MTEPENLLSVFERAREALKSCVCNQDPEKDGCYRCVFAYRRSREMAETSGDTAVDMLDRILAHRDELEEVPSLRGVTINATFDSELEARFVEALRRIEVDGARAVQVRADLVNGKPGYVLKVGEHTYYMETQADLGASDGVVEPSRPDFLIRPARPEPGRPPVAVFTDAFEFHRDATDDDSLKRMALVRAGFLVWSLTWHDLEFVFRKAPDVPDLLAGVQASDAMAALAAQAGRPLGHGGTALPARRTDAHAPRELPAGSGADPVEAVGVHGPVRLVRPAADVERRAAGRLRRRRDRIARPGPRRVGRTAAPERRSRHRSLERIGAGVLRPLHGISAGRRPAGRPGCRDRRRAPA